MSSGRRKSNKKRGSNNKTVISADMPASETTSDANGEARPANEVRVDEMAELQAKVAELTAQIGLLTSKSKHRLVTRTCFW